MTNQIYPCLWFDGQAKAAAEFYCSIFSVKGARQSRHFGVGLGSAYGRKNSEILIDSPMVVTFELHGRLFMGLNGGPMFKFNPSISMFITCESINETNGIWNKLIDGGKALMPIDKYPWSERYGWLQDKFGFTWQISVPIMDEAKLKMSPSMLFTGKQFGRAEEAVNFYTSVFENSAKDVLIHYPKEDANAGKVMFSEFTLNNYNIIAMDGPGVHDYSFNEAVSFVVNCETQKEIDYYWEKLTDGGQESMCGWLKDKFGVSWQIVPTILSKLMSDPTRAGRVTKAFLQMKKFDIEKLKQA